MKTPYNISIRPGAKTSKSLFMILILLLCSFHLSAQTDILWQKCLGGTGWDYAQDVQQTFDSGYIVAGSTFSFDGQVTGNHGGYDFWIVKLDPSGDLQWAKCLGGSDNDYAHAIRQTSDSGYIVAGSSYSVDGQVTGNHGNCDFWVVKLDKNGSLTWEKSLGGSGTDLANSVQVTSDGGYIVSGTTVSNDSQVSGNHGGFDCWIVKLDQSGNLQWQKCFGGSASDYANSIEQTSDSGYIIAGSTTSNDGQVTGNHGGSDFWIIKTDKNGDLLWQKCLGGSVTDEATSIRQTNDGRYIVAGYTYSLDGQVSGNHGGADYWVVKLDQDGNITWQKCFGGTHDDGAYEIEQTSDSGYVVAGYSFSPDGQVSGNHGGEDYWIVKIDQNGELQGEICLGGTQDDEANSIRQTQDGNYIVAGWTFSSDGQVSGSNGAIDYWVVYLSSSVGIKEVTSSIHPISVFPNPFTDKTTLKIDHPLVTDISIEIYSMQGIRLKTIKPPCSNSGTNRVEVDISELPAGVYLCKVISASYTETVILLTDNYK